MINVKELAGWCRRVAISLHAGLDILSVLERETGEHACRESFAKERENAVVDGTQVPTSPIQAPPVLSDFDAPMNVNGQPFRRLTVVCREQSAKCLRPPPIFLYSDMLKVCGYAVGRVREGATLSEAFSEVGSHFPKLFVPMIAVAERSGSLSETFAELARYYEYQLKIKREIQRMMIYPIFNIGVSIFVMFAYIVIAHVPHEI